MSMQDRIRMFFRVLLFGVLGLFIGVAHCLDFHGCDLRAPLGVSNGGLPTSNLSASSSLSTKWGPSQARLNTASSWCGGLDNSTWINDWIQVDLGDSVNLTGIAIQGNYDNPADVLLGFHLEISENGISFKNHTDSSGKTLYYESSFESRNKAQYFWFSSFPARVLRIKASKLFLTGSLARFCIRFELFGCRYPNRNKDLDVYPVGLENGIIPDSHLTSSTANLDGQPPFHARLNIPSSWCVSTGTDQWLQIDLGLVLAVTAIATQGHYGRNSNDLVSTYLLAYSNNSQSSFSFVKNGSHNKTFRANNGTSEDPVMNHLDSNMMARYIRIYPLSGAVGSDKLCLRLEIYARNSECSSDLTAILSTQLSSVSLSATKKTITSNIDIYSPIAWCTDPSLASEVLQIDFGSIRLVSGIVIAGHSEVDAWITQFSVTFGFDTLQMNFLKNFKGTTGRTETAVNWLQDPRLMRILRIEPTKFVGSRCLRIRILGCKTVPVASEAPQIISVSSAVAHILLKIKNTNQTNKDVSKILVKYSCVNGGTTRLCLTTKTNTKVLNYTNGKALKIAGLLSWAKYSFSLRFLLNNSWSNESNVVFATTLQSLPGSPPSQCKLSKISSSSISVSWRPLSSNSSNGNITGYNITYYNKALNDTRFYIHNGSAVSSYTLSGLTPNAVYVVMVGAISVAGSGPSCRNEARTLKRAEANKTGRVLRDSELALIIVTGSIMLLFLFVLMVKVCMKKNDTARRKKRYKTFMKTLQYLALAESDKTNNKTDPRLMLDPAMLNAKRGSEGSLRHGRVLPEPPVITEHDKMNNPIQQDKALIDTPRTMRRKMGISNEGLIYDLQERGSISN